MNASPRTKELAQRFNETVVWCSVKRLAGEVPYDGLSLSRKLGEEQWSESELRSHCILADPLQSPELKPEIQERSQPVSDWVSTVQGAVAKRCHQLKGIGRKPTSQPEWQSGCLSVYAPEDNLQSLGYFDVDNIPPWDTWVAMNGSYLLAWVPPQMLKFATA